MKTIKINMSNNKKLNDIALMALKYFIAVWLLLFSVASNSLPLNVLDYDAIIFDCDGVLVDTEHLKFTAWRDALQVYNVALSIDEYTDLIGYDSNYIIDKIISKKNISLPKQQVIDKKRSIYLFLSKQSTPKIDAAIKLVHDLYNARENHKLNFKIALASSAATKEIMHNLETIGLHEKFDLIVSGKDDLSDIVDPAGTNKPKPYIYQRTAVLLNVNPKKCLVFEDSSAGVNAAAGANMQVIAVPNQFTSMHDFGQASEILYDLSAVSLNFHS